MAALTDYLIPLLLLAVSVYSLRKKVDLYDRMVQGAGEGLQILLSIVPALIVLLTAVQMLRASGAVDWLAQTAGPVFRFFGIPPETAALVLIRPVSGSAALAIGAELMMQHGVDSTVGLTTAVMLGSTETTFYTISVYFGAAGIRKTRYALPAALLADLAGFCFASLAVRWFF